MFVCVFLGALALNVIHFGAANAKSSPAGFYALAGSAALALVGTLGFVIRPWTFDNFSRRGAGLLICICTALILTSYVQRKVGVTGSQTNVVGMLVQIVSFQGAAVALVWAFIRQHGVTLREGFGLGHRPGHAALLGAVVAFGFIPVGMGLQFGMATLAKRLAIELPEQSSVLIVRLAQTWPACIALGVAAIVIAPLAEESLFRGLFYPTLKRLTFPALAMWVTAVLFAVIHFNALSFIPLVALALALAWIYEKTDNLLAPVVCHATFNAFNFVMLFVWHNPATQPGP